MELEQLVFLSFGYI